MSTISGIGFAPRATMNQPHKNTINNNYKNDLNTDSYTPMSFKGGRLYKSNRISEIEKTLETADVKDSTNKLKAFLGPIFNEYEKLFEKSSCAHDITLEISDYNYDSCEIELILRKGAKVVSKTQEKIGKGEKALIANIKKAETDLSPKGGKIVGPDSEGLSNFIKKHFGDNEGYREFLTNTLPTYQESFSNAGCSDKYKIEYGKLGENGKLNVSLKREEKELVKSEPLLTHVGKIFKKLIGVAEEHSKEIAEFGKPIEETVKNVE